MLWSSFFCSFASLIPLQVHLPKIFCWQHSILESICRKLEDNLYLVCLRGNEEAVTEKGLRASGILPMILTDW
jgi:hypothetical protein